MDDGDSAIVNGKQTAVKIKLNHKPRINSVLAFILQWDCIIVVLKCFWLPICFKLFVLAICAGLHLLGYLFLGNYLARRQDKFVQIIWKKDTFSF
jgi:hypothetical protein